MSGLSNRNRVSKGYIVDEAHRFNIVLDTREIFIHGDFDPDEDGGVDFKMANTFVKNMTLLQRMDSLKPIVVHQNSIGGDWTAGMMMADAIATCTSPVVVITHGAALSMGSIVPLVADLIVTMPSCWWMLHEGQTDVCQNIFRQAKSWIAWEDETNEIMLGIYISAMSGAPVFKGKTDKQIENYIKKQFNEKEDWWISAEDAVKYNLAQGVFGTTGEFANIETIKNYVS